MGARYGAKIGYCFYDNYEYRLDLPGAPQSLVYTASDCGNSESLAVDTGLSIGWGDEYASTLPDQYIDITGLPDGRYRLRVTADAKLKFLETNETNNDEEIRRRLAKRPDGQLRRHWGAVLEIGRLRAEL